MVYIRIFLVDVVVLFFICCLIFFDKMFELQWESIKKYFSDSLYRDFLWLFRAAKHYDQLTKTFPEFRYECFQSTFFCKISPKDRDIVKKRKLLLYYFIYNEDLFFKFFRRPYLFYENYCEILQTIKYRLEKSSSLFYDKNSLPVSILNYEDDFTQIKTESTVVCACKKRIYELTPVIDREELVYTKCLKIFLLEKYKNDCGKIGKWCLGYFTKCKMLPKMKSSGKVLAVLYILLSKISYTKKMDRPKGSCAITQQAFLAFIESLNSLNEDVCVCKQPYLSDCLDSVNEILITPSLDKKLIEFYSDEEKEFQKFIKDLED